MDKHSQIGSDISELLKVYKMTENMNHFFKKGEIWVVKEMLTNAFWCKKPDMMTFVVCLHLSWSERLFISTELWSLLMSRVIISVLNINFFRSSVYKIGVIFFISGKNMPFSAWSKKGLQKCFQKT